MKRFAVISNRVYYQGEVKPGAIIISADKIEAVSNSLPKHFSDEILDQGDLVVAPALIDAHVHINEPGRTEWEGFESATNAAAAGGISTLIEMPLNASPVTTTVSAFKHKIASTEGKLSVDCGFYGGITPTNLADLKPLIQAGVWGIKAFMVHSGIDEFPQSGEREFSAALPLLKELGVPLLVHAEMESVAAPKMENSRSYKQYLASRPEQWEYDAIKLLISLAQKYSTHIHIVHLAAPLMCLPIISEARRSGVPLTVETCPHYLTFTAEEIADGDTRFKCAPPIRNAKNREALWNALKESVLDFVASDHSPAPAVIKEIKSGDLSKAWGGISGLQLTLPLIWSGARERGISIPQISSWLSGKPAKIFGLDRMKGEIAPGLDADLVIWNPEEQFVVEAEKLFHRHKITPYDGMKLFGVVKRTFVRGNLVFDNGKVTKDRVGKVLLRAG